MLLARFRVVRREGEGGKVDVFERMLRKKLKVEIAHADEQARVDAAFVLARG